MSHSLKDTIRIARNSVESIGARITTTADPTGNPSRWAFTTTDDPVPTEEANDGGWEVWNSFTKKAVAVSPSVPASDADVTLAPGTYDIWVKWIVGSERPWKRIGRLEVY